MTDGVHFTVSSFRTLQDAFHVLDKWKCNVDEQLKLLGIDTRTHLIQLRYRMNCVEITTDMYDRIDHICDIHESLMERYNKYEMVEKWLHKSNKHPLLKGKSAINAMAIKDITGLANVWRIVNEG